MDLAEAFEKSATQESEQNAQWVKIFASGVNSLTTFGDYGQPHFDQEELTALVEAAKGLGKKVMVHANGEEAVKRAITAGCDSIEHVFFMVEENLNHLRDSGIIWIPTVFTIRAYRENMHLLEAKAKSVVLDRILEHQLGQLSRARELGVKVAVGSDAGSLGVLHGEGLMEEMKLFKKAGYTLPEILYCSSTNGGGLLGLGSYGKVQSHYPATFLVSRGTPFQLPRKIVYLERIIVKGSVME